MRFYVLRPPTHTPTHPHTHPRRLAHVTYRLEPRAREDAKVYLRSVPHVYSVGSSPGPEPTQKCTSEVHLISWEKSRARAEEEKPRARAKRKSNARTQRKSQNADLFFRSFWSQNDLTHTLPFRITTTIRRNVDSVFLGK